MVQIYFSVINCANVLKCFVYLHHTSIIECDVKPSIMEDIIPKLYKGYKVIMRLLLNMETSVCYTLMLSVAHDVTDYEFGIE